MILRFFYNFSIATFNYKMTIMFFIVLGCKISIDINAELSHDTAKEFNHGNNNFKKDLPNPT